MLTEPELQNLEALHAGSTSGEWEAEYRSNSDSTQAHAVVTDESGNELFDSLNRGYKVSLLEQESDEDGHRFIDTAGFNDLACATALHNEFPALAASLRAAWARAEEMEAAQADRRRLVRELDVAMNGLAGAAKQASLCDLVAQMPSVLARMRREGALTGLAFALNAMYSSGSGEQVAEQIHEEAQRLKAEG